MSIDKRAIQFKRAIQKDGGTYDTVSQMTGINSRTLKRIAAGETDPRFSDVIKISKATGVDLYQLACFEGDVPLSIESSSMVSNFSGLVDMATDVLLSNQEQVEHNLNKRMNSLNENELEAQALGILRETKTDIDNKLQQSRALALSFQSVKNGLLDKYSE